MLRGVVRPPDDAEIAAIFERVAELLAAQDASPWRVRAYRSAAHTCRNAPRPLAALAAEGGRAALEALPGIGSTLSAHVLEILASGRLGFLERLEGQVAPEDLFTTLPGVGERLAARLHRELGAETLEDLELAAWDGRLAALPGVGPRRAQALRDSLARVLGAASRRHARAAAARAAPAQRPSVQLLLAVDREYREAAAAGRLRRIRPRRFNPKREAWLPVLHVERDGWSLTALYSNTGLAHELGRTRDWVVIYAERDGEEDRCTVVTETSGPLRGRRVVRGRERECEAAQAAPGASGADAPSGPGEAERDALA
jgi:Holliday junction resolvasome RuvABC DNA-binding subunit